MLKKILLHVLVFAAPFAVYALWLYIDRRIAKTPRGGGPPRIKTSLTAQDGALYLGPVKITALPRINWR